jgi:hypothetical protein
MRRHLFVRLAAGPRPLTLTTFAFDVGSWQWLEIDT